MLHLLSQKFHEILLRTTSESKEFNLGFNVKTLNEELPKIPLLNIYGNNLNVQVPCKVSYRQIHDTELKLTNELNYYTFLVLSAQECNYRYN